MKAEDRRYHKRQLESVQAKTEQAMEAVKLAIGELADDDYEGTEDTRARLDEAKRSLVAAAGAVEAAVEQLP